MSYRTVENGPRLQLLYLSQDRSEVANLAHLLEESVTLELVCVSDVADLRSLEAMGATILSQLCQQPQTAPFFLLAYAGASAVTFEAATQLLGRDEQVGFLGAIDPLLEPPVDHYYPQRLPIDVHIFHTLLGAESRVQTQRKRFVCSSVREPIKIEATTHDLGRAIISRLQRVNGSVGSRGYSPLVTIQTGSRNHDKVFCIPGAGDSVFQFLSLATSLGEERPVIGLQPRGIDESLVPHASVEAAAQCYASAIASLPDHRPLHLIGHSFGGWVAFETARLLECLAIHTTSLTLIDSSVPKVNGGTPDYTWAEVIDHWVDLLELATPQKLLVDRAALAHWHPDDALSHVHNRMAACGLISPRSRPEGLCGSLRTFAAAVRSDYTPRSRFLGKASYVFAYDERASEQENAQRKQATLEYWYRFIPKIIATDGPGNHITILKSPHAERLGHCWLSANVMADGGEYLTDGATA